MSSSLGKLDSATNEITSREDKQGIGKPAKSCRNHLPIVNRGGS